jgi:hypothetical protein
MDFTTILIIVVVIALAALYFYNRSRPAPQGTYDDKDVRSSGSIGGGTRAYDDKDVRSSGSIGGGTRAYDTPEQTSGGSIGDQRTSERNANGVSRSNSQREDLRDTSRAGTENSRERVGDYDDVSDADLKDDDISDAVKPTHNDRRHKSGGSFGS